MTAVAQEQERRTSNALAVYEYFKAHPLTWTSTETLERVGGRNAWRTRLSECRRGVRVPERLNIVNRQSRITGTVISEYRYIPWTPLGRDASERIQQKSLF